MATSRRRPAEFGDYQTPSQLAQDCCRLARRTLGDFQIILEPTCGKGNFLAAAAAEFPSACLVGYELSASHCRAAREALQNDSRNVRIKHRDFFACDWIKERKRNKGRMLILGNPPWVTNSQLGALGSTNLPEKRNVSLQRGIDAMTGQSNFDIAEAILLTLIDAMQTDCDALAMLVKTSTARRIIEHCWRSEIHLSTCALHPIAAKQHFDVHADASLLLLAPTRQYCLQICLQASEFGADADQVAFGLHHGQLVTDPTQAEATSRLAALTRDDGPLLWRSGVKHDVSRILELRQNEDGLVNGEGTMVDIEPDLVYPLAKGADVAHGRTGCPRKRLLIPQRTMKQPTSKLARSHPKIWRYLCEHAADFASRKSSVYRNRDPFALFGIGPYTFSPWKIAICGLYKRLDFTLFSPIDSRPVVFDDTCYFLGMESAESAEFVLELLQTPLARQFFQARVFWDSKRPVTAKLLRSLSLRALAQQLGRQAAYDQLLGGRLASA